jgi:hypothetical protein
MRAMLHLFAVSNRAPNPSQGESAGTTAIAIIVGGSLRFGTMRFYTRAHRRQKNSGIRRERLRTQDKNTGRKAAEAQSHKKDKSCPRREQRQPASV